MNLVRRGSKRNLKLEDTWSRRGMCYATGRLPIGLHNLLKSLQRVIIQVEQVPQPHSHVKALQDLKRTLLREDQT